MRKICTTVAALALIAAVPTTAMAVDYPPAGDPGKIKPRKGKGKTFKVSKEKGSKYKSIKAALKKARGGDTIKVANGTYREGVQIKGSRYDGLKLVGNTKSPGKVVLDVKKLKGASAQNSVLINGADAVTVKGFKAKGYKANGFFAVNVTGYTLTKLIAAGTGTYGIYAFNSKGGIISDSSAYNNNDSGFYIGQTPPQAKPRRSIVTNVKSYDNVLGFSGTNMRYVTIQKSDWFNNGSGIVPNALKSEKYPPPANNVITGNRIFWNNLNFYRGAPFEIPKGAAGGLAGYPIGVGVLLFGSQNTTVSKNQVYGNWLTGIGAIEQVLLSLEKDPKLIEASVLRGNTVRDNVLGKGGADLNGRDLFYDGTGSGNCFANNQTRSQNLPTDNSTFASCPGPAKNTKSDAAQGEAIGWIAAVDNKKPETYETFWLRHPHAPNGKLKPKDRF